MAEVSADEIIATGYCADKEELFLDPDPEQSAAAMAICQECPLLLDCTRAIGPVAVAAMHDVPKSRRLGLTQRVVASQVVRWSVVGAPTRSVPPPETLPSEPGLVLAAMRTTLDHRPMSARKELDMLFRCRMAATDTYAGRYADDRHGLDDKQWLTAWRLLCKGLLELGSAGWRVLRSPDDMAEVAAAYLRDSDEIRAQGLWKAHQLAIYNSPAETRAVLDRYSHGPGLSPYIVKTLMTTGPAQPELAIERYRSRIMFFRSYFAEFADAPDHLIHYSCRLRPDITTAYRDIGTAVAGWRELLGVMSPASLDRRTAGSSNDNRSLLDELEHEAGRSQMDVIDALHSLPRSEQDAVARAYGLEWLLSSGAPSAAQLRQRFGTDDLEAYVEKEILGKLRDCEAL